MFFFAQCSFLVFSVKLIFIALAILLALVQKINNTVLLGCVCSALTCISIFSPLFYDFHLHLCFQKFSFSIMAHGSLPMLYRMYLCFLFLLFLSFSLLTGHMHSISSCMLKFSFVPVYYSVMQLISLLCPSRLL